MNASSTERRREQPAPCRKARNLLISVVAATGLLVFVTGSHLLVRTHHDQATAERWMQTLSLSAPALWPAGSPRRHPETLHPGIDLRHAVGVEPLP